MGVDPTSVVEPGARIPASTRVGPFCFISGDVELGEHCELVSHVVLAGPARIGSHNRIFPFASLGLEPQDISFAGEKTRLEIGDHNSIRESVTIHRGTAKGGGVTRVGSHTLIMAYSHIAHDCLVSDGVILANGATLGGHVHVGQFAVVGALSAVHQYCRVGKYAFIGGGTIITRDVLPFARTVAARDAHAYGLNTIGLQRRGFSAERLRSLHHAFKVLLASKLNTSQALERLRSEGDQGEDVTLLIDFIESSQRGVIK